LGRDIIGQGFARGIFLLHIEGKLAKLSYRVSNLHRLHIGLSLSYWVFSFHIEGDPTLLGRRLVLNKPRCTQEVGGRIFLSVVWVALFILSHVSLGGVHAQGGASDQKSTLLPVARYLMDVGT